MSTPSSEELETTLARIASFIVRNKIRINEYFHDFDKLRAGAVSQDQFRRCLAMTGLGTVLGPRDFEVLFEAFATDKKASGVSYASFLASLTSENRQSAATVLQKVTSEDDSSILAALLPQFAHDASSRGLILKSAFKDFDRHNTGFVTLAQFRRAIQFKTTEAQFGVLQRRYQDNVSGNVRYLDFCADVAAAAAAAGKIDPLSPSSTQSRGAGAVPSPLVANLGATKVEADIEGLLSELKKQVKQYRVRVDEPFRDHDRLRTGVVTPAQFMSGLGKIKLQKMTLTTAHLELLTNYYAVQDSQGVTKVAYSRFVEEMESVFTEKGLEKNPLKTVQPDLGQYSTRPCVNALNEVESEQVDAVLNRIKTQVRTHRLFLKPFFQDFDRAVTGVYQTQACTRERFERVLALNGLQLTAAEYALIEKRFEVKKGGNSTERINYVLFCSEVDPVVPMMAPAAIAESRVQSMVQLNAHAAHKNTDVTRVVEDIQLHCYDKRLRLAEFLRDFDPLRTGLLQVDKFTSGLSIAGIILNQNDLELLKAEFGAPGQSGFLKWMNFTERVDEIFTTKGLEGNPTKEQQYAATLLQKRQLEHMPKGADNEEVVHIINKIAENVRNRGVLLPPFFKDFDRHNTGRISATQFQQVLSRHRFPVTAPQVAKLTTAFSDPREPSVVNVRQFIKAVDSSEDRSAVKDARSIQLAAESTTLAPTRNAEKAAADLELIMVRLRSHVARERVRVREFFADIDRMRKGLIPLTRFKPCLDNIGVRLSPDELQAVADKYTRIVPNLEPFADYVSFCQDVDPAGGTMGLEKSPMKTAPKVEPRAKHANALDANTTSESQRELLENTVAKMRATVKARRMLLHPFFADFDKLRKERVTVPQFHAALDKMKFQATEAEMANLVACLKDERGDIDYAKFMKLVD